MSSTSSFSTFQEQYLVWFFVMLLLFLIFSDILNFFIFLNLSVLFHFFLYYRVVCRILTYLSLFLCFSFPIRCRQLWVVSHCKNSCLFGSFTHFYNPSSSPPALTFLFLLVSYIFLIHTIGMRILNLYFYFQMYHYFFYFVSLRWNCLFSSNVSIPRDPLKYIYFFHNTLEFNISFWLGSPYLPFVCLSTFFSFLSLIFMV